MPASLVLSLVSALLLSVTTPVMARSLMGDILHKFAPSESHSAQSKGHKPSLSSEDVAALYSEEQRKFSFAACKDQFPLNRPLGSSIVAKGYKAFALCSDDFAVLYSPVSKTPMVVTEKLTRAKLASAKGLPRSDQFFADPRLPQGSRAELADFRGSGRDRGHNAPAANRQSTRSMAQSFNLSNMVLQNSENNQMVWSKIESDVRKYVERSGGEVYVFTGPLFDDGFKTFGANNVWEPTRLFKLVYDASSQRAWAYVLPNAPARISPPMDYGAFVQVTGLQLLAGLPVTPTRNQ